MATPTTDMAVRVRHASKTYRIYRGFGRGWLLSRLPFVRPEWVSHDVEALKDVSFDVPRGETLGILGRNGSGKSTLLKIISGVSWPTSGTVEVHGQVRALLALGINFHPHFTGRENILFGSLALGIPKSVVRRRLEEIIEFAELEDAIDTPIQFYSNGMRARLAAAVSFQEAPEILIIDEALAAGDAAFINKCMNRIEDLCRSGSTVLFVSHGIGLVERLCSQALLLDDGRLLASGQPSEVVAEYRRLLVRQEEARITAAGGTPTGEDAAGDRFAAADILAGDERIDGSTTSASTTGAAADPPADDDTLGTGEVMLEDIWMHGADGVRRTAFDHGEDVTLVLSVRARRPIPRLRFYLELHSEALGVKLAEIGSNHQDADTGAFAAYFPELPEGRSELRMQLPSNPLGSGGYYWNLMMAPPSSEMEHDIPSQYFCQVFNACPFMSYSFPGQEWARHRQAIMEPPVRFTIEPAATPTITVVNPQEAVR